MHRCKKNLASRARFALLSMCLGCFVAPRVSAQAQPAAAPPVQTPAPVQGSTPDQMAVPQTPQNQVGEKPSDSHPRAQEGSTPDLRLGPGDLVEVSVYGVPELATKARVSNDGDLYLPLIDYVHVADLSLEESQKLIEKRLDDGGFVRNPHVTIFVDDYSSQGISLLGEVGKPGIYPVLGNRRLFDVFSAAGGLTDRAGNKVTKRTEINRANRRRWNSRGT